MKERDELKLQLARAIYELDRWTKLGELLKQSAEAKK
jgi:hypothetical protein